MRRLRQAQQYIAIDEAGLHLQAAVFVDGVAIHGLIGQDNRVASVAFEKLS